ncbi:DUF3630 family protein [Alteromonas ponticola]|uniref:DUF3630 family protein n=1 Tax=Alteromonas aquimaris TaxID=2998417 RepID=A0ABT3PBC5_9ALTE|nr:DUF3630 family protein [Alteromonas aquimaris]MCW8109875.1 DUF3630 family protein [Alteromonas aquimaris]
MRSPCKPLDKRKLADRLVITGNKAVFTVPLPSDKHATTQFIEQFLQSTGTRLISSEWGADRFQAVLEQQSQRFYLHIEWLCEAMWLEYEHSTDDIENLVNTLTD